MPLTPHQIRQISVAGLVAPRSVRRAYSGARVKALTFARVDRGARTVGLPPPPRPRLRLAALSNIRPEDESGGLP
jgi:hypothetical protein